MKAIALVLVLLLPASAALAQSAASPSRLIVSDAAIARGLAEHPPTPVAHSRDSLKNGTIIGAVVGAAIFGGYVTFLCKALQEPSDPSCFKSSLLAIGIGAGGGAAAGAGVDALFVRVRMPLARPRRN
jgi:hypothetical protein